MAQQIKVIHNVGLIVLATTRIKENAVVIHTISADFGRRSFVATIGRSCPMAMLLPLSILDAEIVENPKSTLWRARGISSAHPLGSIRTSVSKNTMALFMSEVLYRTVKDGEGGRDLYDWLKGCIITLDSLQSDFSNYHLRFLLEFAAVLGFSPAGGSAEPFAGEYLQQIRSLVQSDFASSMLLPLSGSQRADIAQRLIDYIAHHTESAINIQSLKVLSEVFR